jgi:hypothetical protein
VCEDWEEESIDSGDLIDQHAVAQHSFGWKHSQICEEYNQEFNAEASFADHRPSDCLASDRELGEGVPSDDVETKAEAKELSVKTSDDICQLLNLPPPLFSVMSEESLFADRQRSVEDEHASAGLLSDPSRWDDCSWDPQSEMCSSSSQDPSQPLRTYPSSIFDDIDVTSGAGAGAGAGLRETTGPHSVCSLEHLLSEHYPSHSGELILKQLIAEQDVFSCDDWDREFLSREVLRSSGDMGQVGNQPFYFCEDWEMKEVTRCEIGKESRDMIIHSESERPSRLLSQPHPRRSHLSSQESTQMTLENECEKVLDAKEKPSHCQKCADKIFAYLMGQTSGVSKCDSCQRHS